MIKTLFTFGLMATSALAQAPAPGGGGDDDDNMETCDFKIGGSKLKCDWYQECYEEEDAADKVLEEAAAAQGGLNGCILKGNHVCKRYEKLGQSGKIVANTVGSGGCHPSTTCCDGACCTEQQECLPMESGTFTYGEWDKTSQEWPGLNAAWVARNEWKLPNGDDLENRPMHCVNIKFDATTGGKAVFTPMMAMVLLFGSAIAGFRRSNTGFLDKIAPAFIMLSGFFLMLSEGWVFALFTALVASATMAAPRDGFKGSCLVLGQLMFAWVYFGGSVFFFSKSSMKNYFNEASGKGMSALESGCSSFYDFYGFSDQIKPWFVGATRNTYGLCSREFIGFQVIMAYVNAFALFSMVTHTFMDYIGPLAGAPNAKTTQQTVNNPAAGPNNA